jgi:nucleoside-diphosphate-sugar epimerase
MTVGQTVLLVGGTGRTGRRVLEQLLSREVNVHAIVRSAGRLPAGVATNPRLTVVEADLLNPFVQWAAVRPDTLLDGDVSEYALHEGLVSSLSKPDSTNRANVAHAMCELATVQEVWDDWKGKLPVVVNAGTSAR